MPRSAPTHCGSCGVELTDENANRRAGSTSFRSRCKKCASTNRRAVHDRAEQNQRLFVDRIVCDICKQPERSKRNGVVRLLNKDHDHSTGEWRGLLCSRCNMAIGLLADNVALLKSAIEYLENPPGLVLIDDEPPESRQSWRKTAWYRGKPHD
ncbi:hypothetical protein CH259_16615 [Rhodococcus sp. 05-2254-4]|nr:MULTISPECIES: endonuclease domain-containing protein [unclassified Rhodococcus (in: high G+C Gram-positive bacteria)]OZE35807.1 hypothetical protein CH259_16615 [Rhodococcus sp. 05-2254-4]OZE48237.1 hypothetical protein CH261_09210 [Rhodococcus sp. 05-2254-3]OZE49449.1 hypothetical protein CH283_16995 [Rhodococcus sp. 05-2254-2]